MSSLPPHLAKLPPSTEKLNPKVPERFQRERIIAAAISVFAEHGYWETTVGDLVAASKSGVGTFYDFVKGKDACFAAVLERAAERGREAALEAASTKREWAEQVAAGLRALLELSATEPELARVFFVEGRTAGENVDSPYESLALAAASFLKRGRANTDARLPDCLEEGLVAGAAAVMGERIEEGVSDQSADFADLIQFLLAPYIGKEEADRLAAWRLYE